MNRRFGLFLAWAAATGLATVLAWQVVGAADDQISDAPTTPLITLTAPDPTASTTPNTPVDPTTPESEETTSTVTTTPPQSTTAPDDASTTAPDQTTSTTVDGSNTTTTTTSGIPATTTAVSQGGTVTVTGFEPNVELVAVVAVPGWSYEVTTNDGTRVEVRFRNVVANEIRVRCEWKDGQLVATTDD